MSQAEPQRSPDRLTPDGPTRTAPPDGPVGPVTPATGAKAAAVGLWVVVAAGLAWGVSQALMTAGKLFG